MHEKTCMECRQKFFFKEGDTTEFKDGLCHDCYSIDGEMWMDSNCNLYYIDDDGHRIPAPTWREEQLWEVEVDNEPEEKINKLHDVGISECDELPF